jgi:uncharacterized protein YndB with AHSA1/START domain
MHHYVVRKTLRLNAKPSEVWDALTNPLKTKKYFFNCEVLSDWQVGSSIVFRGRLFLVKKIELVGKILKIEHGKLLQYTLQNRRGDTTSFSIVTDKLTYENGKTTLSVTDHVGKGVGAEKRYKRSKKGWDRILHGLKDFVERNNKS